MPSLEMTVCDVITLVVKTSELDVVEVVVGAEVVVAALVRVVGVVVGSEVVVSEVLVVVSVGEVVVVVSGAEVSLVVVVVSVLVGDAVVSATEVVVGSAVVLVTVAADAGDVDVASGEASVAEPVLMEVLLLLLAIVKDRTSGCLDEDLMKEGAMLAAKTTDDNVTCARTS